MFGRRFMLSSFVPFFMSPSVLLPTTSIGEGRTYHSPPFGTSKGTVAQDRRSAAKRRAVKRARKLGQA